MSQKAATAYAWLRAHSIETRTLGSAGDLLGWDQRTYLPPAGQAHRAEQFAVLARLLHRRDTDPRIGECLADLEGSALLAEPTSPEAVNAREWRRAYERAVRIPERLAEEMARATSQGEAVWERARPDNDWAAFAPVLERILGLLREKADCLGYPEEAYDALLDEFEPGETTRSVAALFDALAGPLTELVQRIAASPRQPDPMLLVGHFPAADQERFGRTVAAALGFDFAAGRLDVSAHPFTAGIGPGDVRFTTRYTEDGLTGALFGTLHETGHALYEQGLPAAHWGTPRGQPASLGVHESQSRLYENLVGRSPGFWRWALPRAMQAFPTLAGVDLAGFLRAVNAVSPSLIRVEADEVTYNLHILLRFELERALLRADLRAADVPAAWNERMHALCGIEPPDVGLGALQDVHWSAGLIGYFPTYTLGNVYAAQLFAAAERALGPQEEAFARGDFAPLTGWLRTHVHALGATYAPRTLVCEVTGSAPEPRCLLQHLTNKYSLLYAL